MILRSLLIIALLVASSTARFAAAEDVARAPAEAAFSMTEAELVDAAGATSPSPETETFSLTRTTYCAPLEAEGSQRCHVFINGVMVQRRLLFDLPAVDASARFSAEVAALRGRPGGEVGGEIIFRAPSGNCVVVTGQTLQPYAKDAITLSGLDAPEAAAARDDHMLCGHVWVEPSDDHPETSVMLTPKEGGDRYLVHVIETSPEKIPRKLNDAITAAKRAKAYQRIEEIRQRVDEIKVELALIEEAEARAAEGEGSADSAALNANKEAIQARVGVLLEESTPTLRACFVSSSVSRAGRLILRVDITKEGHVNQVYFPYGMSGGDASLQSCLGKAIHDWDLTEIAGLVGGRFVFDLPFVFKGR